MEPAEAIRQAVQRVSLLRQNCEANPALSDAVAQVKRLQSRRFSGTYSDLLAGGEFEMAARFFLEELYSDKDYASRDAQFSRIAGALQRLFSPQVVDTAVSLAKLHALTEELDQAMGRCWMRQPEGVGVSGASRYVAAWRAVGRRSERLQQLEVVIGIGHEMARLTRAPGLKLMLKMMRGPANAAGLGSLQRFLEAGFGTFAAMARRPGNAEQFLSAIEQREQAFIVQLFDTELVACGTKLAQTLGVAR